jgi:hypothetical protein
MFLHGGWLHIIGNMVFLWAFGPEIEDAMGRPRYLVFYLLSGVVASVAQIAAMRDSTIPNLGASGAIAGVMGAFLITYPRDRIRTLLVFGFFYRVTVIPAALLIGLWFITQLFSQLGSMSDVQSGAAPFGSILVYDVSRWGRFQDIDEGAYYEHICKRAGISIRYCAEPFENDGSPVSAIVKNVKRLMAGEYSRELSVKVFAGQCRLIEHGFRQGGPAGWFVRPRGV